MIPPGERSIRNIPLPHGHRHRLGRDPVEGGGRVVPKPSKEMASREAFDDDDVPAGRMPRPRRRSRFPRIFWLIAIGVVVIATIGALLLSTVFAGAVVVVYPRTEAVTPPQTLGARLQAPVGVLAYQQMTVRRTASATVAASGTARVSRQASGMVTIYNTYSTASQRLIANTRFEAPDGKIYRVRESVTVPGATKNADETLRAGTITATVYADSPGVEYNKNTATRFTIPGFKGDPRYDKFYAESQGGITGGFVGNEPAVPPAELAKAEAALRLELDSALRQAASSELPEGYLPVSGAFSFVYENIIKTPQGSNASLAQSAQATAAIVRASDLATAVARATLGAEYKGEAVAFADMGTITIAVATSSNLQAHEALTLALSGSPTLVWQFDPAAVREELVGKGKATLPDIIRSFDPAIVQADATIRPFWQGSFPSDPNKIKISIGSLP